MTATRPARSFAFALCAAALLAGACTPAGPLRTVARGDELAFYDFSRGATFEEGAYTTATLRIREGQYMIDVFQGDNALWWGQWGDAYADTVIDVTAEQDTNSPEVAFGVMCRVRGMVGLPPTPDAMADAEATPEATATSDADAAPDTTPEVTAASDAAATAEALSEAAASYSEGDGYLFLIQGSGTAGIFRARGRALEPLADWQASDAIVRAPGRNQMRAVCVGDYLALYVNDVLVAEATDDAYTRGQVGLAASAATRLGVRVRFDNLSIAAPAQG